MLSSLLRPKKGRQRVRQGSPFSSPFVDPSSPLAARQERMAARHATADFTETETGDDTTEEEGAEDEDEQDDQDEEVVEAGDEDGDEDAPLLPIFSAAHLDSLPVYNLTHAIRLIVLARTETTLTWDQLRSPQVSQFLVKPMQQQIRTSHFSRATLYALMANCLQFQKEGEANPGNAGNSRTRALVCELLSIKLLKEYNIRELIDALSYDFFPLQGLTIPEPSNPRASWEQKNRPRPAAARTSTLEVAIRASAKRFLAHPLVVQQLEAIWAGTIVFHSAADSLHRPTAIPSNRAPKSSGPNERRPPLLVSGQNPDYGATRSQGSPDKHGRAQHEQEPAFSRRTVTLYDPRDASLFKLSRLRVPRYRQFFSTCSLAILLILFVVVLKERSMKMTSLEFVFWFWSAGFMLDEVVGFNEQGFSLYIMSFWNTFDLGILLLLVIYYCMRLYEIFVVTHGRLSWNSMAYDVLATNAVLLFPRLFSVLDHYRYFSQLLIAFRLMAVDLVAVFILILIACSGFFVAFTLSFGENEYDAAGVAFKIFQILMGFTPAAWEAWTTYNVLGKAILVLFLFICHFLVVTILISVLTNSFMAIVSNANEEHQFVFAVNTISMVKNDALFSYVAPSNIFAWILTPLRYCLPFTVFIKLNRTVIKVTHFPLLFGIYAYEKMFLARSMFEATDLVENGVHGRQRLVSFHDSRPGLFSPSVRIRQDSVAGFLQKDKALDEVFRLAPRGDTLRSTRKSVERRKAQNVVSNWMDYQGSMASPPQEQDRSIVDRLEMRRQARKATMMRQRGMRRDISGTRSVASDPAEFLSTGGFYDSARWRLEIDSPNIPDDAIGQTDADGDDELMTNEEDEGGTFDKRTGTSRSHASKVHENEDEQEEYFPTPMAARFAEPKLASSVHSSRKFPETLAPPNAASPRRRAHVRNVSSNTILYKPLASHQSSSTSPPKSRPLSAKRDSGGNTGMRTPLASGRNNINRSPEHSIYNTAKTKPRPIFPPRQSFQSDRNLNIESAMDRLPKRQIRHRPSSLDMGMSDLGLYNPGAGMLGAVPNSFATQMAMATGALKGVRGGRGEEGTEGMMGRLMLARMKTLEEGFAEVVKEFRGLTNSRMGSRMGTGAANSSADGGSLGAGPSEMKRDHKGKGKAGGGKKKHRPGQTGLLRSESEMVIGKGKENEFGDKDEGLDRYGTKAGSL